MYTEGNDKSSSLRLNWNQMIKDHVAEFKSKQFIYCGYNYEVRQPVRHTLVQNDQEKSHRN